MTELRTSFHSCGCKCQKDKTNRSNDIKLPCAPGGEWWPTEWQAILPGLAIRLAEQDCLKLGVKNLQEVAEQQVIHGTYSEASPLRGIKHTEFQGSWQHQKTGCVFLVEVGDYGKWCGLCVSKSKLIHVFIILLDYIRNNHNHNATCTSLHLILTLALRDKIGRSGPVSSLSFFRWGYQGPKMSTNLP